MIQSQARPAFRRRRQRVRFKLRQAAKGRARLSVFRSSRHIYAQIIDDVSGVTLASASTLDVEVRPTVKLGSNTEAAKSVGLAIGRRALEKGFTEVVFDRGGRLYHGRVRAVADGAREAGLKF